HMSGPDPLRQTAGQAGRGRSMPLRKRRNSPVPTPEQARRQSGLVQCTWRHFREAAPMIAFLNTRHETLDALPLHLAIESDEGLERVEKTASSNAWQASRSPREAARKTPTEEQSQERSQQVAAEERALDAPVRQSLD